jgi:hypothetical protein
VESNFISRTSSPLPINYPKEFDTDLSELFGYILMVGAITPISHELNFSDCHIYPLMVEHITKVHTKIWPQRPMRLKGGNPRFCGRKNCAFVEAVFGGLKYIQPKSERMPKFVWLSPPDAVKSFLRGLLGSAPKVVFGGVTRIIFRNLQLLLDTQKLLKDILGVNAKQESFFLILNEIDLAILKKELKLEDESWWL